MIRLEIPITLSNVFWLAADFGGSLSYSGGRLCVFTAVPAFWIGDSEGLYRLLYKNLTEFIQYPLSIYHRGIRELLTFVLPYAFISYYPCAAFYPAARRDLLRHIPISDTSGGLRCIFLSRIFLAAGAAGLQQDRILIKT